MSKTTIRDFAHYVRSKNAGSFWLTFDVFLKSKEDYDGFIARNVITPDLISRLYDIPADKVRIFFCGNINTIKISVPRKFPQGSPKDKDIHAGQQAVFLADHQIDI